MSLPTEGVSVNRDGSYYEGAFRSQVRLHVRSVSGPKPTFFERGVMSALTGKADMVDQVLCESDPKPMLTSLTSSKLDVRASIE